MTLVCDLKCQSATDFIIASVEIQVEMVYRQGKLYDTRSEGTYKSKGCRYSDCRVHTRLGLPISLIPSKPTHSAIWITIVAVHNDNSVIRGKSYIYPEIDENFISTFVGNEDNDNSPSVENLIPLGSDAHYSPSPYHSPSPSYLHGPNLRRSR